MRLGNLFIVLICSFILFSCASNPPIQETLPTKENKYRLKDKGGEFILYRSSGLSKEKKEYIVKTSVYPSNDDKKKILEKVITISTPGVLKKKLRVLRPKISQYTVWFDGKKYFTQLKLNTEKKSFDLTLVSPEKQWSGKQQISFPRGTGVFCFYSQLIECAGITGFIKKSIEKGAGTMNFHLIWEGYPYFHEQYVQLPKELFSQASLTYQGQNAKKEAKFSLSVSGQVLFYFVDKNGRFLRKFWVAEGLSLTESEV